MIPEQAKSEIIKRREAGATWTAIAKWLESSFGVSVHRTTIQRWHDRNVLELGNAHLDSFDDDNARIKLDKKVETYKHEAYFYKKLYNASFRDNAKKELVVDAIKEYAPNFENIEPVKYLPPTGDTQGSSTQTVVAPLTDTHIGEYVDKEQMLGMNVYSFDIFNRRLYGWATQLLTLVNLRRNSVPIDDIVIPMLGDMISGDIHEELARSNLDNCMEQMIRGANLIAQALMYLAPHFKSVRVPCVVGNHGRMTRKPPMKDKYMDWDFMLYQWVAAFCKNQDNISFSIPKSYVNMVEVNKNRILLMHGDSISGAGSNMSITKAITSLRGVFQYKKNYEVETGLGYLTDGEPLNFDSAMIGHFHRIDEIDIGTGELHICGCMKGPDEFALQRLHTATKPKQIVTYWHPKYGSIGKEIIYLNIYDKTVSKFKDSLPEVWAS